MAAPVIEYGPMEGRERWYTTTHHIDVLRSIAEHVATGAWELPGRPIQNVKIWYDRPVDYHALEFDLEGDHYRVEYYKIFTATRNGDAATKMRLNDVDMHVWDFFLGGRMWGADFDAWRGRKPLEVT